MSLTSADVRRSASLTIGATKTMSLSIYNVRDILIITVHLHCRGYSNYFTQSLKLSLILKFYEKLVFNKIGITEQVYLFKKIY